MATVSVNGSFDSNAIVCIKSSIDPNRALLRRHVPDRISEGYRHLSDVFLNTPYNSITYAYPAFQKRLEMDVRIASERGKVSYTIEDIAQFYSDLGGPCGNNIVMGKFLSAAINTIIKDCDEMVLKNDKFIAEGIRIDGIGFGLQRGTILSWDGVGRFAANEMEGGTMLIKGARKEGLAAGDFLAKCMSGGEVVVAGDVGDNAANSMTGGRVIILGEAGSGLGKDARHDAVIKVGGAYNIATAHRSPEETELVV